VNAERVEEPIFENMSEDSSIMRKWKCLFLKSFKGQSPVSAATEILNWCQFGTNASMCLGFMWKNYGGKS
jgi:hypothetical protein